MSGNIQGLTLSSKSSRKAEATSSVVTALLPIMAAVFVAFLVTGLAMPVLPLHVHEGLGLDTFVVGLNGVNTLMSVLEDRKKRGITDVEGKTATPINDANDKYERGRKTLEALTGQPQAKPAKGFGEFSPQIDRFLKEHLFADVFDSDVLNYRQRELVTVSALAAMPGVEPQLESHLSMGMNTGLTEGQLNQLFDLIEKSIGRQQAETARKSLAKVVAARQKKQ